MKYLAVLALVGIIWIFWQQGTPENQAKPQTSAQEYMVNLKVTDFDQQGNKEREIIASNWAFVPSAKKSNIVSPLVTVYKVSGDIWHLSADKAYAWHKSLDSKINKVEMLNNVQANRAEHQKFTPTVIKSEAIDYYPEEDKITSMSKVTMEQPELHIEGYGMLGYIDKNWVQLLDRTTTISDNHTIKAKQATFDDRSGKAVYEKDVTVHSEKADISSDSLEILRDKREIKTLIAYGNPAKYDNGSEQITGPELIYNVANETLHAKNSTLVIEQKQDS